MTYKNVTNADGSPFLLMGEPVIDNWEIVFLVETPLLKFGSTDGNDLLVANAVRRHPHIAPFTYIDERAGKTEDMHPGFVDKFHKAGLEASVTTPAFTWYENSALFDWLFKEVMVESNTNFYWQIGIEHIRTLRSTIRLCTDEKMARQFLPVDSEEDSYDEHFFATLQVADAELTRLLEAETVRYRRYWINVGRSQISMDAKWRAAEKNVS